MSDLADAPTSTEVWSAAGPRVHVLWDGGAASSSLPEGKELVVGRGDGCAIQVLHPSVSRRHLRLVGGAPISIEDLGSSRGTRVDGQPLVGRAALRPGQVVEFGGALLVVQVNADDAPSSSVPSSTSSLPPRAPATTAAKSIAVERLVPLVAKSNLSVLITGETGAGKEVMADRIHRLSLRAAGPFVKLNCAALPESLLESELFGHERGAFTGAVQAKLGLIETADKGTLLLDEIGEMPAGTQAKLLRVLESREVRRVGSVRPTIVDVRVLAATHRDLDSLVRRGEFRQDLLFRLNGVTLTVPPLRDRPGELLELARRFASAAAGALAHEPFTSAAEAALLRHTWPGNIRELRNVVERAIVLAEGDAIDVHHLLLGQESNPGGASLEAKVADYERAQIVEALDREDGNQTRAAAALGMSRRTLINRIEAYGIARPRKQR